MKPYDHKKIEKKWQKEWTRKKIYLTKENAEQKKSYVLDMFPYPSGEGLHVGHPKGYIATDIYSRFMKMNGHTVLHPMGWDAFGLPAENYAIKNKIHPEIAVKKNIKRYKEQLSMIGFNYDWSREINTTDPKYYRWTQWIFLQLFKKGLAYESFEPINWCPSCQTGLANEDLEDGRCERCGSVVEKKPMRQWVLKITEYADRLLQDLDILDGWPESVKESQRNWIGKSEGAEIDFRIERTANDKSHFVLLHGRTGGPDKNFFPWLKDELEKRGYQVEVPRLPNTDNPNDEEQANFVQKNCKLDENTVVVGHSFGGVVALRLLERGIKVGRVVLAATPYSGNFLDKENRPTVLAALKKGFEFEKIRNNAKNFVIIPDERDTVVPLSDAEKLHRKLGGLFIRGKGNEEHFCGLKEADILMASIPTIRVFTTRPDTLFGATYMVLAPEHPFVTLTIEEKHNFLTNKKEIAEYVTNAKKKTEIDRTAEGREKTGVPLKGVMAVNPVNGEKIPVFVADYVLGDYGTGAIMAVPAHDERDYEFAKKFKIPIKEVIIPNIIDRRNPPVAGKEVVVRQNVHAIVRNPKNGKYLALRWPKYNWVTFPMGGVEEGEDAVRAAMREVEEETGYKNLKLIRVLPSRARAEYFAKHKNQNRVSYTTGVVFELVNEEMAEIGSEEKELHETFWLEPNKLSYEHMTHAEIEHWLMQINSKFGTYTGDGVLVNSAKFDGMTVKEAKSVITKFVGGKLTNTYKLRDWVFSRQRYWGEPIPLIHCEKCGIVPVPEKDLPVKLPKVKSYAPTGTGESPLAAISKWVNVKCPRCKGNAKRETNTMPQWAGSSWYYLRYMDPKNSKVLVDPKKETYWAPVDMYVGGTEHATRHLIYARFWHKFLFDQGVVSTKEPFMCLKNQGLIMGEDGRKMSKRFGNVVNPDEVVKLYGADTLRVYEMFMGPFENAIAWSTDSMIGSRRFIERVWRLREKVVRSGENENRKIESLLHRTIKKVTEDITSFKFNTAISAMMIFLNELEKAEKVSVPTFEMFIKIVAPFAPHIADEIWSAFGHKKSVHLEVWPAWNEELLKDGAQKIIVQVNGKVRATFETNENLSEEEAKRRASDHPDVKKWLENKPIKKLVYIRNKLINIVV